MANGKKVRNLEAVLRKKEEATGGRKVEFSWAGKHYEFDHPLFQSDETQARIVGAKSNDEVGAALLGKDKYKQFHADGGQAAFLMILMQDVQSETQDVTPDGTPTQPSTS